MAYINYNDDQLNVTGGNDSIVLIRDVADIPGGVILDVSEVAEGTKVIEAGHIIVKNLNNGTYFPLGVDDGQYVLPTEEKDGQQVLRDDIEFVGVLKQTILVEKPFGAVTTIGEVNAKASPYPVTSDIISLLPRINFLYSRA